MNDRQADKRSPIEIFFVAVWLVHSFIVWIYNNTGKSVFACILFHTLLNVGRVLSPKDTMRNPLVDYPEIHYSTIALTAVVVVLLWYTKTLNQAKWKK